MLDRKRIEDFESCLHEWISEFQPHPRIPGLLVPRVPCDQLGEPELTEEEQETAWEDGNLYPWGLDRTTLIDLGANGDFTMWQFDAIALPTGERLYVQWGMDMEPEYQVLAASRMKAAITADLRFLEALFTSDGAAFGAVVQLENGVDHFDTELRDKVPFFLELFDLTERDVSIGGVYVRVLGDDEREERFGKDLEAEEDLEVDELPPARKRHGVGQIDLAAELSQSGWWVSSVTKTSNN